MSGRLLAFFVILLPQVGLSAENDALGWLPGGTYLVAKLPTPQPDEPAQLRDLREMLASFTASQGLVGAIAGAREAGVEEVYLGEWSESGETRRVLLLTGENVFFAAPGGHVVAAVSPGVTLIGSSRAVARCLETDGRNALVEALRRSIESRADSTPAAWAWTGRVTASSGEQPPWPAWTLNRALDGVRSATLLASRDGDAIRFRYITAAEAGQAGILAADLAEHLALAGPGGDSPVQESLDRAVVRLEGAEILLDLTLSAEALGQVARSRNAQQVFRWELSPGVREKRERIPELVGSLELDAGGRVADIGAGRGFLAVRLARVVGETGKVWAVDIEERVLRSIEERADRSLYPQLETVLGAEDDPLLPAGSLDAATIVNAYHEMPKHREMLAAILKALKPGGRLLLLEPWSLETREQTREEQVGKHHIAPELLESELTEAGFELVRRDDEFVRPEDPESPRRDCLVLGRRPAGSSIPK